MSVTTGLEAANTPNYSIDDILRFTQEPGSKRSGGFRKVLGGVAGAVGNVVAPGLGTAIGGLISGGNDLNSTGLLGDSTMQFLELQRQMQMESRAFETASTVLKVRHDCAMTSIRNMK